MNSPLVTVITVCYNSENNILKTLLSVKNQTYSNIEHVIIDGNSTDNTNKIIKSFKNIHISEPDEGIYFAMNKGLGFSNGKYICFLNSGDYYTPQFIEKSIKKINSDPSCKFVCSNLIEFNEKKTKKIKSNFPNNNGLQLPFLHPTLLCDKEIFEKYGLFDESFKVFADINWMLKINFKETHGLYFDFTGVYFEKEGISKSLHIKEYYRIIQNLNFIDKFFHLFKYIFSNLINRLLW